MGKRSNFVRRANDDYATPLKAVPPLVPHLRDLRTFAEPCCGQGALVGYLESCNLTCVYKGDITTGQDALAREHYNNADAIITNPPYSRELMHRLITHFALIAPTWLLLEFDWLATQQARPFIPICSDIVAVGRLRLIPGSKWEGKESFAWCRFDDHHAGGPLLHNGAISYRTLLWH